MMTAIAYRYANVPDIHREPKKLRFLLVNRNDKRKKRYFPLGSNWTTIIKKQYPVSCDIKNLHCRILSTIIHSWNL